MKTPLLIALVLTGLVSVSGCTDSGPTLVNVTGLVTENGKPLEGAAISFLPMPENKDGKPAEDTTGPQGNYKAMTAGRSGVVPGKYHIVVTKIAPAPANAVASEAFKDDPFMAQLSTAPVAKSKAAAGPAEFAFDREVPAEGGSLDFDVKSKAAGEVK